MRALAVLGLMGLAVGAIGCGGDDNPGDPTGIDAAPVDASADADASAADAGLCAGQAIFSGAYIDWDGNSGAPQNTLDTVITEVADSSNTFTINAPNGRVEMCLPADATSTLTFANDDYLPLRYTFDPIANATAVDLRGLSPDRADALLTSVGVTRDAASAQVLIAVRQRIDSLDAVGAPVIGAQVSLGNGAAGSFVDTGDGVYGASDTLAIDDADSGGFVLFANTEVAAGTTTVTVTPPTGQVCDGPDSVALAAGELAAATFVCGPAMGLR